MQELEEIVAAMEEGQLPLEKIMEQYERGMALVQACSTRLAQAEQRVEELDDHLREALAAEAVTSKKQKGNGKKARALSESNNLKTDSEAESQSEEPGFSF